MIFVWDIQWGVLDKMQFKLTSVRIQMLQPLNTQTSKAFGWIHYVSQLWKGHIQLQIYLKGQLTLLLSWAILCSISMMQALSGIEYHSAI